MTTYELYLSKHAELTAKGRAHIKQKNFGIPSKAEGKKEKKQEGNYPIHDRAHARSALSYGSRYLSPSAYAALKKRVYAKYPGMKKSAADDDALDTPAGTGEQLVGDFASLLHARRMGELGALAKAKGYEQDFFAAHPTLTNTGAGLAGAAGGGLLGAGLTHALGQTDEDSMTVGTLLGALTGAAGSAVLTNYLVRRSAENQLREHAKNKIDKKRALEAAQEFADESQLGHSLGAFLAPGKGSYDAGYGDMLNKILKGSRTRTTGLPAAEVGRHIMNTMGPLGPLVSAGTSAYQAADARQELQKLLRAKA